MRPMLNLLNPKSKLVEFSEAELILVSSTGHKELLENKLSQTHSGLCQNLENLLSSV